MIFSVQQSPQARSSQRQPERADGARAGPVHAAGQESGVEIVRYLDPDLAEHPAQRGDAAGGAGQSGEERAGSDARRRPTHRPHPDDPQGVALDLIDTGGGMDDQTAMQTRYNSLGS